MTKSRLGSLRREMSLVAAMLVTGMPAIVIAQVDPGLSQDSPEKFYLSCKVSDVPHVMVRDLYQVPPPTPANMARDIFESGAISLTEPPPETWEVDRARNLIVAGPGGWAWTFRDATFGSREIVASFRTDGGTSIHININRINGTMVTSTFPSEAAIEAWRKKHGKPLPSYWTWTQQCTASQSPKI